MKKVFVIGSHKTGTSSMKTALILLGYRVLNQGIGYKFIEQVNNNDYSNLAKVINSSDAFQDSPWNHGDLYKWLYSKYPDTKFILTTRSTRNWLNSYIRWNDKHNIRKIWFYKLVSQGCYGVDDFLSNYNLMISKYEARNKEIVEFFKGKDNFMEFDIENNNGWDQLCGFLEVDSPNSNFPHANRTK
jgi:hypothetical protein